MTNTLKRAASLLLSCCFLFTLLTVFGVNSSAADSSSLDSLTIIRALGIMQGDESGNLNLGSSVTRAEFTKMMVAASQYKDSVGTGTGYSLFKDVKSNYWASEYIKTGVDAGWFVGYVDGTFRPNNTITLAETCTALLRLLGYDSSTLTGSYPTAQMSKAQAVGLLTGLSGTQSSTVTRSECVTLFYNLMLAKNSSGSYYLNVLEPTLNLVDSSGNLDLVALVSNSMTGPLLATSSWQSQIPFTSSNATYYLNGTSVASSSIAANDVLYYSTSMRTVWAWSKKTTGTITAVSPSTSAPTAVTVAGRSYSLETQAATYDLSSTGDYSVGDVVTLLLGKTGGVAFVVGGSQISSDNLGVVTSTADASFTDSSGNSYTSPAVTVVGLDGETYVYPNAGKTYCSVGSMVKISVTDSGLQISSLSSSSVSGKVNSSGTALGNVSFASGINILDVYGSSGKSIAASRLANCTISKDDVIYASKNTAGEINTLILDDYTGDLYQYGVVTSVKESTATDTTTNDSTTTYTITYDINGSTKTYTTNVSSTVSKGPVLVKVDSGTIKSMESMTSISLDSISGTTAISKGQSYPISNDVAVYEYRDMTYYLSSLGRVTGGGYTLTGYYDKAAADGGCVRVIVAQADS